MITMIFVLGSLALSLFPPVTAMMATVAFGVLGAMGTMVLMAVALPAAILLGPVLVVMRVELLSLI